jgi:hypothetical protein
MKQIARIAAAGAPAQPSADPYALAVVVAPHLEVEVEAALLMGVVQQGFLPTAEQTPRTMLRQLVKQRDVDSVAWGARNRIALMRHQTRQRILALPHLKLLRSYPFHAILCRADRGHFSGIGGSCHEEEESLVPSDVVDFSIVARQRVHYRAGPESCSEGDEVV